MENPPTHNLGYVLYPPRRKTDPGYSQLDIFLSDRISGLHFDPKQLRLPIVDDVNGVSMARLDHPYVGQLNLRLCAGPIDLYGYEDKRLEIFTFGGQVVITPGDEYSRVEMKSEAPILVRVGPQESATLLMEEAELLLALRRGVWDEHPGEYEKRLSSQEPLELYHALLEAILERVRTIPDIYREADHTLLYQFQLEAEAIEELSEVSLRPLADIL